jgi:hypothetical protein
VGLRGGFSRVGACTWVCGGCFGATWYAFFRSSTSGWACWSASKVPRWLYPIECASCSMRSESDSSYHYPRMRVSTRVRLAMTCSEFGLMLVMMGSMIRLHTSSDPRWVQ